MRHTAEIFGKTELYLGLDYGRVWGQFDIYNSRDYLIGTFCGLRGQITKTLTYDIFVGKPIHKPDRFTDKDTVYGFNVNMNI